LAVHFVPTLRVPRLHREKTCVSIWREPEFQG